MTLSVFFYFCGLSGVLIIWENVFSNQAGFMEVYRISSPHSELQIQPIILFHSCNNTNPVNMFEVSYSYTFIACVFGRKDEIIL